MKEISSELSGPQTIENMQHFFLHHLTDFRPFCFPSSTSDSSPGEARKTWLFFFMTLLFFFFLFENQLSNILRHSQLDQHHLDCLWSWTNLHSFCRRYFQTRLYIILFTVKVKSLREKKKKRKKKTTGYRPHCFIASLLPEDGWHIGLDVVEEILLYALMVVVCATWKVNLLRKGEINFVTSRCVIVKAWFLHHHSLKTTSQ